MALDGKFKVLCKNNYYEPTWGYLAYKMKHIYDAEIIIGDKKDTIWVDGGPGMTFFFSFKKFAEIFKILDDEDLWDIENGFYGMENEEIMGFEDGGMKNDGD